MLTHWSANERVPVEIENERFCFENERFCLVQNRHKKSKTQVFMYLHERYRLGFPFYFIKKVVFELKMDTFRLKRAL